MSPIKRSVVAVLLGGIALVSSPSQAEAFVQTLFGGLTTGQVECESLCTAGPLTGGLAGQLEFTMESMEETEDPDVVTYVGVNTITTTRGTLVGTDYGIWNLATGEFVDYMVFEEATGAYAGKEGALLIIGEFDPVSGTGQSNYIAVLH